MKLKQLLKTKDLFTPSNQTLSLETMQPESDSINPKIAPQNQTHMLLNLSLDYSIQLLVFIIPKLVHVEFLH